MRLCLSLATLLIFGTTSFAEDTDTEAVVSKLGGKMERDKNLDETANVSVLLETAKDTDLSKLAKLPEIGAIRIVNASKVSALGFGALKELPNLQRLTLGICPLNELRAAAIGKLRTLKVLHIGSSGLNDAWMQGFKKLVNLTSLDLLDAPIGDKSVKVLCEFTKLQELNLAGTKITDNGVTELGGLKELKSLKLHKTDVTRKGIDAIEKALPKLTVSW